MRAKQAHKNFLVARGHWADINRRRAAITRRQTSAAATEFGFLMSPRRNCRIDGQQAAAGSEARIAMNDFRAKFVRWLGRTPVQTFLLCPLAVVLFELALNRGRLTIVPWGLPLLAWGYLQYRLVGSYRLPRAGGTSGMDVPPDRIIAAGPYRYTRNPMYLGHLIFLVGVVLTFWSWFAVVLLIARAIWFQRRVWVDEERLEKLFGAEYVAYCAQVKRWIPGVL
jgi:protein-S-isoprenylcysteine O-methyltransferase Ste14